MENKIALLEKNIRYYNEQYRLGVPVISDIEYDKLVDELRKIDPSNSWFSSIEPADVKQCRKKKLPIPMKSLNKIHTIDEFKAWTKSLGLSDSTKMVLMPKFDGVSLLVNEETGEAYSRGGSENEGQDCTKHYAKSNNGHIYVSDYKYTFGEFIIPRDSWNENFKGKVSKNTGLIYKSSRNTVAGMVNSPSAQDILKHARLFKYGISESDWASSQDINTYYEIINHLCNENNQEHLYCVKTIREIINGSDEELVELFREWSKYYQIDGIVIYINDLAVWSMIGRHENTGNPQYAIAYKSEKFQDIYITTVKRVNWKVSKSGALKPTVEIEAVDTGDCIMDNPTGNNAKWISDRCIGANAIIKVTRSGGVIPKILEVIEPATQEQMEEMYDEIAICPSCGSPTYWNDGVDVVCSNKDCCGKKLAEMIHFFSVFPIDGVGDIIYQKIFDSGVNTICKFLDMTYSDIIKIDGIGESVALAIDNGIEKLLKDEFEIDKAMHASNCFEGIGIVKANKLLDMLPDSEIDKLISKTMPDLSNIGNSITEKAFINGMANFLQFIKENYIPIKKKEKQQVTGSRCSGMAVCFSGIRDKDVEAEIIQNGGSIASGVSSKTTHLVVKDKGSSSSKTEKAKKLGIIIMDMFEFKNNVLKVS